MASRGAEVFRNAIDSYVHINMSVILHLNNRENICNIKKKNKKKDEFA